EAPAAGLAGHGEAMLAWVCALMDRYPALVVEGCAAGGSRTDAASGAVFPVQSLTDQQDPLLMPPIVAAAPLAITPEQSGIWASVDGAMGDEELAFSLATALLGRIHLAGRIDTLNRHQRDIVRSALSVHRTLSGTISQGSPLWPLGLPGWRDEHIAYGLRFADDLYILTWRRGEKAETELQLPLHQLGPDSSARVLFPAWARGEASLDAQAGVLRVQLPRPLPARLIRVSLGAGEASHADHYPGGPRIRPGPQRGPGRALVLPGHQFLRMVSHPADLPLRRPRTLGVLRIRLRSGPRRASARSPGLGRDLGTGPVLRRRPVLAGLLHRALGRDPLLRPADLRDRRRGPGRPVGRPAATAGPRVRPGPVPRGRPALPAEPAERLPPR